MSRKPSGPAEAIERAIKTAETTQSAVDLRRALAVALPVLHGLSLKETAGVIGRSEAWVAKERLSFIQEQPRETEHRLRGGRRNQLIPAEEEDAFMESVCQRYIDMHTMWRLHMRGWTSRIQMSFVEFAHLALEDRIQRKTTRTTVYNLLARTGKRRFADYTASMWSYACRQQIPSSLGPGNHIGDDLLKRFGLSRRKGRTPK